MTSALADPDAGERDGHGQAHGQHGAERDDQDDDREAEAEQLGGRLLELGEDEAAELHVEAVDVRQLVEDLVPQVGDLVEVDVLRHLDVGVGDRAGLVALRDEPATGGGVVGALDAGDEVALGHRVEQRGHRRLHGRVVHALLGVEHDRAQLARALAAEALVEDVEAVGGLGAGEAEVLLVVLSQAARDAVDDDQGADPEGEYEAAPIVAPGTQAGEHGGSLAAQGGAPGWTHDASTDHRPRRISPDRVPPTLTPSDRET